ncbi:MAG: thiamine-monophosphate kinase [Candidatus Hermodarchaeota archaeon]
MVNNINISKLGEIELIKLIEDLIFNKTGKKLIRDDSFFFPLKGETISDNKDEIISVLNSDMLVSTTDIPPQMSYKQIGRKAVLMNISDLIVKGVMPKGIIISFGLNKNLKLKDFRDLMEGIIDYCKKWNLDYIGGDLNQTNELIINPTVFGFQKKSKIIYRNEMEPGDYVLVNGKFGLTGVGFDILLNKKDSGRNFQPYQRCVNSVLNPCEIGFEAIILSENNIRSASIDSSDGLAKSLTDLMLSNPTKSIGFEIEFNEALIDEDAIKYSEEFNVPLEKLVFNGGEEFIHIFTINPKNYDFAIKKIRAKGGQIFKIGKVIPEETIYVLKDNKKFELKNRGYEHFK